VTSKTNREVGEAYERLKIKELGGRHVSGSGSSRELKEDGDFPGAKLQVKSTTTRSITLQGKDLVNLQENAMNCGKTPVLLFGINHGEISEEWVAVPLWMVRNSTWLNTTLFPDVREEK
jgi:hypothetical protein